MFQPGVLAAAVNLTGKFSPLVFGSSEEATTALGDFLCVDSAAHHLNLSRGTHAIVAEVDAMLADAKRRVAALEVGSEEAEREKTLLRQAKQLAECLEYVLYQEAGSSDVVFENGHLKRDCDQDKP